MTNKKKRLVLAVLAVSGLAAAFTHVNAEEYHLRGVMPQEFYSTKSYESAYSFIIHSEYSLS